MTSSTSFTASKVYTSIGTPSSGPKQGDFYYEALSAWDSADHYDQIGISSDYCGSAGCQTTDDWTIFYSVGTPNYDCVVTYNFNATAATMPVFTTYTFEMSFTGSHIVFSAYDGTTLSGTLEWTYSVADTASYFYVHQTSPVCNKLGFSVFQEVDTINTTMNFPQWDFQFANTYGGTTQITTWQTYTSPAPNAPPTSAHGYYVDYTAGSYFVRIANEAFWIALNPDGGTVSPGSTFYTSGGLDAIGSASPTFYCTGTACLWTGTCNVPPGSGWSSYVSSNGNYVQTSIWDPVVNTTSGSYGGYYVDCVVSLSALSPQEYSSYILYITVS